MSRSSIGMRRGEAGQASVLLLGVVTLLLGLAVVHQRVPVDAEQARLFAANPNPHLFSGSASRRSRRVGSR